MSAVIILVLCCICTIFASIGGILGVHYTDTYRISWIDDLFGTEKKT